MTPDQVIITRFASVTEPDKPFHLPLADALEAIRSGAARQQVERIRSEGDKKEAERLKRSLRCYTFSGKFGKRALAGLQQHSGILSLDFDGVADAPAMRDTLSQDAHVLAAFVSPSGTGVKVLVPIEADVAKHKLYFSAIRDHFAETMQADAVCCDVTRACFESWDPDIYINWEAQPWVQADPIPDPRSEQPPILVPLTDATETERRLLQWWVQRFPMVAGRRNANAYILAVALRDFGIDAARCGAVLGEYTAKDFPPKEVDTVVRSAYKDTAKFGSKKLEDTKRVDKVRTQLAGGVPRETIARGLYDRLSEAEAFEVVDKIAEDEPWQTWWRIHKGGRVEVVHHRFRLWLEGNGFRRYYPGGGNLSTFIRIVNNVVEDTGGERIKDFTLSYLLNEADEVDVYNHVAGTPKYFKDDYLAFLSPVAIDVLRDTGTTGYMFFRNTALEVTSTTVRPIAYADLTSLIWRRSIIDRDWHGGEVAARGDFATFLDRAAGNKDAPLGDVDAEHRALALAVAVGRMVHRYRTDFTARALIFNDTNIDDSPNGGSGKGLICKAVSQVRNVVILDGQRVDFNSAFAYQRVSADTEVLVFDDVPKNFSMVRIFSPITEGVEVEKKNRDATRLPVSESPQIVVTTNYAIKGQGGSFARRRWDVELSDYYGSHHTPLDDFSVPFFSSLWKDGDWSDFHSTIIFCLQQYLRHGMVLGAFASLADKQLIADTSSDFREWGREGKLAPGKRLYRRELYEAFVQRYPDYAKGGRMHLSEHRFNQWLHAWQEYSGHRMHEAKDGNGGRYLEFVKEAEPVMIDNPTDGEMPF